MRWLALLKINFLVGLEWRAETFLWILLDIFPTVIMVLLWNALYTAQPNLGGLTLSTMLSYYLTILVIINLAETHFEQRWIQLVKQGQIDQFLTKPVSMIAMMILQALGKKVIAVVSFLGPFSLFLFVLQATGVYRFPSFSATQIVFFLLFLVLGFFVNAALSTLVVLAAFWMDEADSLAHVKWLSASVLGGTMAPFALYPEWMRSLAHYLPFRMIYAVPAELLASPPPISQILGNLGIACIFVFTMWSIVGLCWKAALRSYGSAGG
jgi:ABC-2 type transport system permease protein